ncbi:nuclear transport factor 2 family protein [Streptomyces sp. FIT100]|uniref:nuclear transport factor 2 family protein n=1 Tax=Streptomyces sp. FIT100 TaxID=2837956 RepID=UPI0021C77EC1|nr:nuclear transport factor 2 family protein [Streptomyces sp. FIT100]UUN25265.1 nuclear transport factor 2 family protein [Streptomyces sp. FIT100]
MTGGAADSAPAGSVVTGATAGPSAPHLHEALLRTLYTDLLRIGDHAADDVVYHLAHRDLGLDLPARIQGRAAVTECERALHHATGGTLTAAIDAIAANDFFAAVTGIFSATIGGGAVTFPFCGLWRFRDGLIVEHWQNAYEPAALHARLSSASSRISGPALVPAPVDGPSHPRRGAVAP